MSWKKQPHVNGRFSTCPSIEDHEATSPTIDTGSPLSFTIPPADAYDANPSPFSLTPLGSNSLASSFFNLTAPTNSGFTSAQPSMQPSPITPNPLPLPSLPTAQVKFHRPMERIPTFLGTSEDEVTSKDFMKVYRCATINNSNLNTDEAKVTNFQNYLGSDSPVEDWYEATGKALNKWPDFESAFFMQFPTMEKAKKTAVELERELAGLKLRVEDLGKKEKYGGQEVWSHIAFVENALDLARRAKIEKGTSSLWVV